MVAPVADRLADQLLGRALAVHLGGIDERHPELDSALQRRDLLRAAAGAIADIPGTEAKGRNFAAGRQGDFLDHLSLIHLSGITYLAGQTDQGEKPIVISLPSTQKRSSRFCPRSTVTIT